jgi:hypothetical protein
MEDYSRKRNKPSTQEGYQAVIDRNIVPLLGRKKVQDVKRPDIAGLMEKLTVDANLSTRQGGTQVALQVLMSGNDEFVDGGGMLALRVRFACLETRLPLDDGLILAAQRNHCHRRQVIVQRQWRFLETVGERQAALIDCQQTLAQDRAIRQRELADATNQAIGLVVLDDALGNGRVPFADLAKLLQNAPDALCFTINDGVVFNHRHALFLDFVVNQ